MSEHYPVPTTCDQLSTTPQGGELQACPRCDRELGTRALGQAEIADPSTGYELDRSPPKERGALSDVRVTGSGYGFDYATGRRKLMNAKKAVARKSSNKGQESGVNQQDARGKSKGQK